MNTSISLPGFSEFRLNIRALQNFPSALTDPRVDQEINVVYGLRSKCHGIDAPIPGTNVAATISVKVPGGAFSVVSSIATGELWPDGKMDGEREVTKTCHIPTAASGEYAIRFAGEYGLFVALQGFLGYGCWIGIAADNRPAISKIWQPENVTWQPVPVNETYPFVKP